MDIVIVLISFVLLINIVDYFNVNKTLEEVTSDIQKCSRQFAKRQYTWFNNQMKVNWVNMAMDDSYEKIVMMVDEWLNG